MSCGIQNFSIISAPHNETHGLLAVTPSICRVSWGAIPIDPPGWWLSHLDTGAYGCPATAQWGAGPGCPICSVLGCWSSSVTVSLLLHIFEDELLIDIDLTVYAADPSWEESVEFGKYRHGHQQKVMTRKISKPLVKVRACFLQRGPAGCSCHDFLAQQ